MPRQDIRKNRLAKVYQQTLSECCLFKVEDPRLRGHLITFTRVEINDDMSLADVYFTVGDEEDRNKVLKALYSAEKFFLTVMKDRVKVRYLPDMRFRYDHRDIAAGKVVDLIDRLAVEYKKNEKPEEPAEKEEE